MTPRTPTIGDMTTLLLPTEATTGVTTTQILEGAAKLIREAGWIQNFYESPDGYCTLGALKYSARDFFWWDDQVCSNAYNNATERLAQFLPTGSPPGAVVVPSEIVDHFGLVTSAGILSVFNDAPERTVEEVLSLFDRATSQVS